MRSRSNSGVQLDRLMHNVQTTILNRLNPVTGLFSSNLPGMTDHAWVRDNVYAVHSVWGLALAYKKNADFDEDIAKAYELNQTCVKVMRTILLCMGRQAHKIEKFKKTQHSLDALHAKYSSKTLATVVGDTEWGHLQIDATSLFLLTLAQMTASGLQIIYTLTEVALVQNLVFYIENAYRIPDFGIWERGDKTNHGLSELNASSIGMAKAALQALNDLDLFGAHGSQASVIHVMADQMQMCNAVLQSMLPRESYSKETDAALLSVISYPAFAVEDTNLIDTTRNTIINKLEGSYGFTRFLRDGYLTPVEDRSRLYYEPSELQKFEDIECEWPLFYCYLILDAYFNGNEIRANEYRDKLEKVLLKHKDGNKIVPELYTLAADKVGPEQLNPRSQPREPAGAAPFLWAQSLYILCELIGGNFLKPAELDPLSKRLSTEKRIDTVVQVVVLAQDEDVKEILTSEDIHVRTVAEIQPIIVAPAWRLGLIYSQLGKNDKMGLCGRPTHDVGLLSTSKLYEFEGQYLVFTPQVADLDRLYINYDIKIMQDILYSALMYLAQSWNLPGRPIVTLVITKLHLSEWSDADGQISTVRKGVPSGVIGTIKKLKSGYIAGTRIQMGHFEDFFNTSCRTSLEFICMRDSVIDAKLMQFLEDLLSLKEDDRDKKGTLPYSRSTIRRHVSMEKKGKMSVYRNQAIRHRSILLDANDADLQKLRLRYAGMNQPSSGVASLGAYSEAATPTTAASRSYVSSRASPIRSTPSTPRGGTPRGGTPRTGSPEKGIGVFETPSLLGVSIRKRDPSLSDSRNHSRINLAGIEDTEAEDIVALLLETEDVEEQGDLVYVLWLKKGPDWDTKLEGSEGTTVRILAQEMHAKACAMHVWWLVRLTAGLLEKEFEDLEKAVTDLLVRQKQITVGLPAVSERTISMPLPYKELQIIIREAYQKDVNSAVLAQEMLMYLGMFVRNEPQLFAEVIRLRVGLIIQVMASELARALHISALEASKHLMSISAFEMKTLLHHILSGKEVEVDGQHVATGDPTSKKQECKKFVLGRSGKRKLTPIPLSALPIYPQLSATFDYGSILPGNESLAGPLTQTTSHEEEEDILDDADTAGQWLRRRRIDGALNRVPPEFYSKMWMVVRNCEGLDIHGSVLHQNLTKEMTKEEMKFALTVEEVLNSIPEPEYRQLVVEALMVLTIVVESRTTLKLGPGIVRVLEIVNLANNLFIQDQRAAGNQEICSDGENGISSLFYDSPPSGKFGTITYMCRAVAHIMPHTAESIECAVQ